MTNQIAAQAQVVFEQALGFHRQGRLEEAQRLYQESLGLQPRNSNALHLLGVIAAQTNNLALAAELIGRAIQIDPQAAAYRDQGLVLCRLNRHEEAIKSFDQAIGLEPGDAETHFSRGNALRELQQLEAAVASFDLATSLRPDYAQAHNNRGNVLKELKRLDAAVASYDRAIAIEPNAADLHINRGNALRDMQQSEAAVESYEKAIAIEPKNAAAYVNRGLTLAGLKRFEKAALDYDRAIALQPRIAEAYVNRGALLLELGHSAEAVASYDQALAIKPCYAKAYLGQGEALAELRQFEAAIACYDKAITHDRHPKGVDGMRQYARLTICDWHNSESEIAQLIGKIERDEDFVPPSAVLALSGSPALQRKAAESWMRKGYAFVTRERQIVGRAKHDKIRIGYFSADFHDHATMYLIAELFEEFDRSQFELFAFSFGPDSQGAMRKRLRCACEKFFDVRGNSDREVAALSRSLEIDIAVDLKGFTKDSRPGIFALGAAPLQVSYLGYPGTMGAGCLDYLIGDWTLVPEESRRHYSEKIIYLPNSYQVNDSKRSIADTAFTREAAGLPLTGFVFCCFNNNYKITPGTFDIWMRILRRVEGSVLWLLEDNPEAANNLRREAEQRKVTAGRLIFAPRIALPEHLARHRAADLFVDTLPYNAHTTASDALWAGLPVLTCVGEAFAGRVAASLLFAIRLPELVTSNQSEYEELAVELAMNPKLLAKIKGKLWDNRLTTPLFNTKLYARHLESAFARIHERFRSGLPIEHIDVESCASPPLQ
ncbi:MAG TPA: tetratricopeptide repeat protein [Steroidobacteraceae bacterium]|nr:tetratricopeptide repeat protein [Steroidobacteraceae bacterium]